MGIDSAVPGYKVRTMALPYGLWPKNRQLAWQGSWTDPKTKQTHTYKFDAVLEVAGGPTRSPYDPEFNPHSDQAHRGDRQRHREDARWAGQDEDALREVGLSAEQPARDAPGGAAENHRVPWRRERGTRGRARSPPRSSRTRSMTRAARDAASPMCDRSGRAHGTSRRCRSLVSRHPRTESDPVSFRPPMRAVSVVDHDVERPTVRVAGRERVRASLSFGHQERFAQR